MIFFFSFINVIETSGLFLYFRIRAIAKKKKIHQFVYTKIYNPPLISLKKKPTILFLA